jgi:hypothetical protein
MFVGGERISATTIVGPILQIDQRQQIVKLRKTAR